MFKKILILLAISASCLVSAKSSEDVSEGRVLTFGKCPVSQATSVEFSPIGALLVKVIAPIVVDKAIDVAANAAKAAGNSTTTTLATASYQGNFYRGTEDGSVALNKTLGCIVFLRGTIQDKEVPPVDGWRQSGIGTVGRLVGLAGNPGFYMESTIEVSSDKSFFRLVPQYLYYGKAMKESFWRPSARGVAVHISMTSAGQADPFASAVLSFLSLQPETEFQKNYLAGNASKWMSMPAQTETANKQLAPFVQREQKLKEYEAAGAPPKPKLALKVLQDQLELAQTNLCKRLLAEKKEDDACPRDMVLARANIRELQDEVVAEHNRLSAAKLLADLKNQKLDPISNLVPFNVEVSMTESAAGSEFLKFVGSVLTDAKPGINEAIKAKLDANSPESKATAQTALDVALVAAIEAKNEVEKKLIEIAAAPSEDEKAKLKLDLVKLKLSANIAYRKAGLPEPYPGLVI